MSFAAPTIDAPFVLCDDDRSLSSAGATLRASFQAAIEPPSDRSEEIYHRVVQAMRKAQRQDGVLITPNTFGRTLDLLEKLPRELPLPEVVVESESEVGLDWDEAANRVLSLTIRDTTAIGFAGLFGDEPVHGKVVFTHEIPETLRFFFGRLYPRSRRRQ